MTVPGSDVSAGGSTGLVGRRGAWLAVGVAAALMLSGCQSGLTGLFGGNTRNTIEDPGPELPAGQLYNEGLAHMNGGKFKQAVKSFEEVDRQHPYSEYARKALVMSAFANYRAGNDDEAVEAANRFLSLYPASEDAAYAHYIIGQSYFRQVPDVTRDQDATRRALASMQEIVTNYPDSEYARDAREKILAARDQLAGKEMQIGRYYLERRDYIAAINRFRVVVTEYQNTRHIEEALYRLTEANLAMGLSSEAQTAAAVLGHNYPDSQWYKDAYNLLQGGGLEPNENPGSWIARAFGRDVG